jgi:hypothetical protein
MNLDTILTATYYIKFHKLTALEHYNTIIMNWHRTLKYPAQDLSPSRQIGIYPVTSHIKADIFHRFCKLKGIREKEGKMINGTKAIKAKAVPLHAVKGLERRGGKLLLILDLGTRWGEWSASRPGRVLAPEKGPRYPLCRKLGGPQSWSGHRG